MKDLWQLSYEMLQLSDSFILPKAQAKRAASTMNFILSASLLDESSTTTNLRQMGFNLYSINLRVLIDSVSQLRPISKFQLDLIGCQASYTPRVRNRMVR